MPVAGNNDAELVGGTLAGNRDAFSQIVARYQSLICSLAYSATGSLGQSEDLAQETFITAWKHLGHLRERDKLRAWLCGIARNRINNFLRREGREPLREAESLENVAESHSPEPLPADQTISNEEQAILWRSLERIPQIYREPLVLFYREHQSVEAVAKNLELTEDTVRQRLSRGRKLLQAQVLAFVEGALAQTNPGKTFTLGVLAALPLLATTAKAATATATATKGGAVAKATGAGAFLQTVAALSPLLLLAGFFGFKMGGDARQSAERRESVATFWRIVVGALAAFIVLPMLVLMVLNFLPVDFSGDFRQRIMTGATVWLGLLYAVVPAALILWVWQRRRKFQLQPAWETASLAMPAKKKWFALWVVLAMLGSACILGLVLADTNKEVRHVSATELQQRMADGKGKAAEYFCIMQFQNGTSNFWMTLRENGKRVHFSAPVDEATLALVKAQGITCPTYVSGRDFEVFGWPGRLLPLLCVFILVIGGVMLLRKPGKFNPQAMDAEQIRKLQKAERVANQIFGTGAALALIVAALGLGLITRWGIHRIAGAEVQQIISTSKLIHCEVFQFSNGTKELWISATDGTRRYSQFIAPPAQSTLALLAERGIACPTYVQGQDFGFRDPNRWASLIGILVLAGGAAGVLRWAWKKESMFSVSADSSSGSNCR